LVPILYTIIYNLIGVETMLLVRHIKYYRYLWPGPIFLTAKIRPIVLADDLVLAKDTRYRRYIEAFRQHQKQQK
jgi:hypothetical protein